MAETAAALAIRVGCEFTYDAGAATPAVFLVRPDASGDTIVAERWESDPPLPHRDFADLYGNRPRRLTLPAGRSVIRYDATVRTPAEPAATDWSARRLPADELPDDVLIYTLPSRYCHSDEVAGRAWELFGGEPSGWGCVQAICDWVHAQIRFEYGASGTGTGAREVLASGTGVCRDFAHVAITFCRALNIPARYAFGYLPDIGVPPPHSPMDFCAWFEAYLGDRWWTFDPRNNQRRIGHIVIGRGRDALDVAMVTTYGDARFAAMTVWADEVA